MTAAELQVKATEHAKTIAADCNRSGQLEAGVLVLLVHKDGGYGVATSGLALSTTPLGRAWSASR